MRQGHQLAEQIENRVIQALPGSNMATHIEPVEDAISNNDLPLDRSGGNAQ